MEENLISHLRVNFASRFLLMRK